jgi:ketosteroid isomerase-like protein
MEPEAMVEGGDCAVATIHNTGRGAGSGIDVDLRTAVVAEMRGGKLVRLEVFDSRAKALEAAGL